jgi:hypothetical protein
LEQWRQLNRGERLMICHAPATTADECEALKLFIDEAALARSGSPPQSLSEEVRQGADPPDEPPARLIANAKLLGSGLTAHDWQRLDDDERYALIKLGSTEKPSHNFKAALLEFVGKGQHYAVTQ